MSEVELAGLVSIAEFEAPGRAAMAPAAWDYVAGGSWAEESLADNEAAWHRHLLRPRVLVDVADVDLSTTLLGSAARMPLAIAPMAVHSLAHPDGEVASARAAAAAGLPFTLSTMSSRSIEEVAEAAPDAVRWFQLYHQADPRLSRKLVERAAAAGFRAIILTVDLPVLGYRPRDRRSGFALRLPLGNFEGTSPTHGGRRAPDDAQPSGFDRLADARAGGLTWDDLAEIRSWSSLPLVLKGIMTAEDGRLAVEHGVDGIVVSNHGARQLDRVAAPIDVLAEIVAAVEGRLEILVDGGVRSGLDIAVALALGARGVLVGRPILWALAAAGQAGVERALAVLREESEVAFALLGTAHPADVTGGHVRG